MMQKFCKYLLIKVLYFALCFVTFNLVYNAIRVKIVSKTFPE